MTSCGTSARINPLSAWCFLEVLCLIGQIDSTKWLVLTLKALSQFLASGFAEGGREAEGLNLVGLLF